MSNFSKNHLQQIHINFACVSKINHTNYRSLKAKINLIDKIFRIRDGVVFHISTLFHRIGEVLEIRKFIFRKKY